MSISIRIVISAAMILATLTVAAVGFVPTYLAGVNGIHSTVGSFRTAISQQVVKEVGSYFDLAWQHVMLVSHSSRVGVPDVRNITTNLQQLRDFACHIAFSMNESIATVYFLLPPWGEAHCTYRHGTYNVPASLIILPNATATGNVVIQSVVNRSDATDTFNYGPALPSPAAAINKPILQYKSECATLMASATFLPFGAGATNAGIKLGAPVYDALGNTVGAYEVALRPQQLFTVLQELSLTPNSRVLIFDRHDMYVVGISWPGEVVANGTQLRTIGEMNETMFKRAYSAMGPRMLASLLPFRDSTGSGVDELFVDVSDIDFHNATLRIVLVVPAADFLSDVYSTRTGTLIGFGCALLAVVVAAVVFSHALTAPLATLAARAYAMATFEDTPDEPPSNLSEVRDMQTAFEAMRDELTRAKKFLPATVFTGQDDADSSDGEASGSAVAMRASRLSKSHNSSESIQSTHSKSTRPAAVVAGLNTTSGSLSRRVVSVLVVNLTGTHAKAPGLGLAFGPQHGLAVAAVSESAALQRGVLDSFHGDRFSITFNAANTVGAHAKRAALAALGIHEALRGVASFQQATMGIGTGSALVGNMGNAHMMRFCTVGPVYSEAAALEPLCRRYTSIEHPVFALCSLATSREADVEVNLQAVDVTPVLGTTSLLYSVESVKQAEADEWMYQLQSTEKSNPYAALNDLMMRLYLKATSAKALAAELASLPEPLHSTHAFQMLNSGLLPNLLAQVEPDA